MDSWLPDRQFVGGAPRRPAGFTLVELLAVLAILGILMAFAFVAFGGQTDRARVAETRATLSELENLITHYELKKGDYPPHRLKTLKIKTDNDMNEGIEACLAALHGKDHPTGRLMTEKALGNTDEDTSSTQFHREGSNVLTEVADSWGNPVAYFSHHGYGETQTYLLCFPDERDVPDWPVTAVENEETGIWANADSFQLISAGPDEMYGTEDDVTNFTR